MATHSTFILLASVVFMGTACVPEADDRELSSDCREGDYSSLVGVPLAAVTLPADLPQRVIRPGEGMDDDLRPDRLNLVMDTDGVIVRVWCG